MRPTFLEAQYRYLFRSLPQRTKVWHRLYFFYEVFALAWRYSRLSVALRRPGPSISCHGKGCVVVLLSHNRPQNLPILVRGALQNDFVRKVVVSNSNPKVRIREWIKPSDPRLSLIDESMATLPGHRFVLAEREQGEYFLSVDDDIFLSPCQWARFFERLALDDEVPHGIAGHVFQPGVISSNGSPFHHFEFVEKEVDVLIGAYAFTRRHLRQVFALASELDLGCLSSVGNGEDILLSFAGNRRPWIHALGHPLLCASTSLPGVALWKTREAFWGERQKLFERMLSAR